MKGLGSGIKEFKNAAKEGAFADKKDETENEKKIKRI
jgi:Sec-independent protein translocase protein TatA